MSSKHDLARENEKLLRAIRDFANTGELSAHWSRLRRVWPDLLPSGVYELPFDRVSELNKKYRETDMRTRPHFGTDLLERGMSYSPTDRGNGTVRFTLELLDLQNEVRRVWRDAQTANDILPTTFPVHLRKDLLPAVLGLIEKEEPAGGWYAYSTSDQGNEALRNLMGSFELQVDWPRGILIPKYETQFQQAFYVLLKNSGRAKFCQNPECPAPYFIATRATQKYCCGDCLKPIQRLWKLNWWNRVGSKQRRRTVASKRSGRSRT